MSAAGTDQKEFGSTCDFKALRPSRGDAHAQDWALPKQARIAFCCTPSLRAFHFKLSLRAACPQGARVKTKKQWVAWMDQHMLHPQQQVRPKGGKLDHAQVGKECNGHLHCHCQGGRWFAWAQRGSHRVKNATSADQQAYSERLQESVAITWCVKASNGGLPTPVIMLHLQ